MVRRSNLNRAQLVLELERQPPPLALGKSPKGLVEALADLLLEALGERAIARTMQTGGVDDQQDHA